MNEPDSKDAAPPAPERSLITTRGEYRASIERLLAIAQREIRVFDADLADLALHTEESTRQLQQFLVRSRSQRLLIAVHDTSFITRHAPRLMKLVGSFSPAIKIHLTLGDARRVQDCFMLADQEHFARRPVAQQPRGAFYLNDPREGRGMRERFDEIWESSELGVTASAVGL